MNISGSIIQLGESKRIDIPVAKLATGSSLTMPVRIIRGPKEGPCLCLTSTIHGDELNGIEIIRQVLESIDPIALKGTVIAAPIVNVFGFLNQERYLPDRRDLNRSFPGSKRGSTASLLAHLLMTEVVTHADVVFDLHTGSNHRTNLPQLRGALGDAETLKIAKAFGLPVMIDSKARDGSLRAATLKLGKIALAFEGGETHRYNQEAIKYGTNGVLNAMHSMKMLKLSARPKVKSITASKSYWLRARRSGLFRRHVSLGDKVKKESILGSISDPFGEDAITLKSKEDGIVVGIATKPLINKGDALVHIAIL